MRAADSFARIRASFAGFPRPQPVEWLCLAGGLLLVLRYFWIFDDAFVYFRYIDNLLFLKIGLVYNYGEYVEGFSSPLWAVMLVPLRAVHLGYVTITKLLAVAGFAVFWLMLVRLNRELSPPNAAVVNFPLIYLSFNYGVTSYFSSGLETPIIQITAVAYALYVLNPASAALQLVLAVSPLVRPELAASLALAVLWGWIHQKRFPARLVLLTALFNGIWILFRIYYYADLFPSTFYYKEDYNVKQGLIYVNQTLAAYHLYEAAVFFVLAAALLRRMHSGIGVVKPLVMVALAVPVTLYVIKIGGAAIHHRYLLFPFDLTVCAFGGILEHFLVNARRWKALAAGTAIALLVLSFYPTQLKGHPLSDNREYGIIDGVNERMWHVNRLTRRISNLENRTSIESLTEYREDNPEFEYRKDVLDAGHVAECITFYENMENRVICLLTDPILAHIDAKPVRPGHKLLDRYRRDMKSIYETSPYVGRGTYRKAVEDGRAPKWVAKNIETIDLIERKTYNNHDLLENLQLALTFPEKIKP